MEIIVALCLVLFSFIFFRSLSSRRRRPPNLPPGPKPYPIVGNLLQIGSKDFHLTIQKLSRTYGPITSLYIGSKLSVVVSSPEITKELVKTHDRIFTTRPVPAVTRVHDRHKFSMSFLPANDRWRKLRKMYREHMFSAQRLDGVISRDLRQQMMEKLCEYLDDCCARGRVVDLGEIAFITTLNLISLTLFSTVLVADYGSGDDARGFRESIEGIFSTIAAPNVADVFPILKPFDLQGLEKQAKVHVGKLLAFFQDLVSRRMEERRRRLRGDAAVERVNDVLEELFDVMERDDGDFSCEEMKHLLMNVYIGATHTTSSVVHWVMTELIRNPNAMYRVRHEIRTSVGTNESVQESDMSKLTYFKAVVKETLRRHPTGAVLFPRVPDRDIEIEGYVIPRGSQILFNIYAFSRDPKIWRNPEAFDPERFMGANGGNIDFKGQDFQFLPFGCGRRICPGLSFADRMVHLMAATLVHRFDWRLEPGVGPEDPEKPAGESELLLRRSFPLMAIPVKP